MLKNIFSAHSNVRSQLIAHWARQGKAAWPESASTCFHNASNAPDVVTTKSVIPSNDHDLCTIAQAPQQKSSCTDLANQQHLIVIQSHFKL